MRQYLTQHHHLIVLPFPIGTRGTHSSSTSTICQGGDGGGVKGGAHRHVGDDFGGRKHFVVGGSAEEGYADGVAGEFGLDVGFELDPFSAVEGYFSIVGCGY